MKVTLKEIARRAGVTANTVSRALNNRGGISEATQKRILQIAREMNYIPDRIASSLRSKKSNLVGVMVPDISNPYYADIIRGIEDGAFENGFQILLSISQEDQTREWNIIDQFRSLRVEGVLLMPSYESRELIQTIADLSIPCVLINRRYMGYEIPFVMPDNVNGIRQAVSHLVGKGHERIGFLNGHPGSMTSQIRYNAFTESIRESGLELAQCPSVMCAGSYASACEKTKELIQNHSSLTAIMCFSDLLAFGAYKAIRENDLSIPDDIAVVGFDDIELSTIVSPPLTTVQIPRYNMGRAAMKQLLKSMNKESSLSSGEYMETKLIVRNST
ncbi:MAG: LacI family DNA-binding transcriptional regulator [Candidatus Omnitrophica bacterium]|nr:LacI family DNA-binding transcriptional regulator [Candidatus Omnitrophota bacterium]